MTWSVPRTWVEGEVVAARYFNAFSEQMKSIDILETMKDIAAATETTTSTTFTDLATPGPFFSLDTDTTVTLQINCYTQQNTTGAQALTGVQVSGRTIIDPADNGQAPSFAHTISQPLSSSYIFKPPLNPGVHTFTMKYRVTSGTGTWFYRAMFAFLVGESS